MSPGVQEAERTDGSCQLEIEIEIAWHSIAQGVELEGLHMPGGEKGGDLPYSCGMCGFTNENKLYFNFKRMQ